MSIATIPAAATASNAACTHERPEGQCANSPVWLTNTASPAATQTGAAPRCGRCPTTVPPTTAAGPPATGGGPDMAGRPAPGEPAQYLNGRPPSGGQHIHLGQPCVGTRPAWWRRPPPLAG